MIRHNQFSLNALKLFVAGVIVSLLFFSHRITLDSFFVLKETWQWLLLAVCLMVPPCLIVSYRFMLILANQNIKIPFFLAFRLTMIGYFFDLATPSSNGGDLIKAGYLMDYLGSGLKTRAAMTIVIDRLIGLLGLFFLSFIASALSILFFIKLTAHNEIFIMTLLLVVIPLLFFRIVGSRRLINNKFIASSLDAFKWGRRIKQISNSFNLLTSSPKTLFLCMLLSLVNHLFWCSSILMITFAVGNNISILNGLEVFPLAIFGNIFGVGGGFGLGTAGFDLILLKYLNIQNGVLIGILFQSMSAVTRLIGLPFYLRGIK